MVPDSGSRGWCSMENAGMRGNGQVLLDIDRLLGALQVVWPSVNN
jgi:hypothetical protein